MESIQKYFYPLLSVYEEPSKAVYGFSALTHCTPGALKIQNMALRILAVFLAVLFDATLGLGIVCTPSRNSFVFLYNTYGDLQHSFQKYRYKDRKKWNVEALKTWTIIGSSALFLAGVYYWDGFRVIKNRMWQTSSGQALSSQSEAAPSRVALGIFKKIWPYCFLTIGIGYSIKFYRSLPDSQTYEALQPAIDPEIAAESKNAINFTLQKIKEEAPFFSFFDRVKIFGIRAFAKFENPLLPYVLWKYGKCVRSWNAAYEKAGPGEWFQKDAAALEWKRITEEAIKVSLTLNYLLLDDLCSLAKKGHHPLESLKERPYYSRYLGPSQGFLYVYCRNRNYGFHKKLQEEDKEVFENFFSNIGGGGSPWRELYNEYADYWNQWKVNVFKASNFSFYQKIEFNKKMPALCKDSPCSVLYASYSDPFDPYSERRSSIA